MTLDQAIVGSRVRIEGIAAAPDLLQRLLEFGLMDGEIIEVLGYAPMGDPLEIRIGGTRLSLRKREASAISVSPLA